MKKSKQPKQDKMLRVADSSIGVSDFVSEGGLPGEMLINGDLALGKKGNPVTIYIEDEITGETLEINGVKTAFIVVEDTRRTTSGWLAMVVGGANKLSDVLGFLSQITLETLKKINLG